MNDKAKIIRVSSAASLALTITLFAGCGGGGGSNGGNGGGGTPTASNSVPMNVKALKAGASGTPYLNVPTISLTICAPGSATACQTVDNILVDTGSYGLRLDNSAASRVVGSLPYAEANGGQLAEYSQFGAGNLWGSVRMADVRIAGQVASNIPIQISGDMNASSVPSRGSGKDATGLQKRFGLNGILGIGVQTLDCGKNCETGAVTEQYFSCRDGSSCSDTTVPAAQQVANPVARFASNNNGVILKMPSVPESGQATATGTLTFGIGTQANNANTASHKLMTDENGELITAVNGLPATAFIDSGTNSYAFAIELPTCVDGSYCPSSTVADTIELGDNRTTARANIRIANSDMLKATGNFAFDDYAIGGVPPELAILGMPFFYGRTVYFGFDQRATGGSAPYVAF